MENKPTTQSAQTQIQEAKLQEFKDIVAKKYGFTDWSDFKESAPTWKQVDEYYIEAFTLAMYKTTASSWEKGDGEVVANGCEAGCVRYTGGEIRHHKDCKHYPDSLSQKYDQMDALSHPSTKQSVNPPAQEVDVWKELRQLNFLISDLPIDWLGTGLSQESADEQANEWHEKWDKSFSVVSQALQSKAGEYSLEDIRKAYKSGESWGVTYSTWFTPTKDDHEERFNKLIQSLTSTPLQTKGREVEFGKWLSIHCSDKCDDFNAPDGSLYYFDGGEHLKTIEELFQLFLTTNPSNKGA